MDNTVVVRSYDRPHEAELDANRLRKADIEVSVEDDQLVGNDPLLANAVGGVKLRVAQEDADRAVEVLEEEREASLDADEIEGTPFEELEEDQEREWEEMTRGRRCPECGSQSLGLGTPMFHGFAAVMLGSFISAYILPQPWASASMLLFLTLLVVGFFGSFMGLFPLKCKECDYVGKRSAFEPDHVADE
jgi:hypothetical protein